MQKTIEPTPERLAKGDIAETDIEIRKGVYLRLHVRETPAQSWQMLPLDLAKA